MIRRIFLDHFRNYQWIEHPIEKNMVVITGKNGSGKTNLLEALSLFQSKRGLRKAKGDDLYHNMAIGAPGGGDQPWQVAVRLEDSMTLGTAVDQRANRFFKTNSTPCHKKSFDQESTLRFLWMTPLLDHLFIAPPANRREFLDSLVSVYTPHHHMVLKNYTQALKERLSGLKQNADQAWLLCIEKNIAQFGLTLHQQRCDMIKALQDYDHSHFSCALSGSFEDWLEKGHQDLYHAYLKQLEEQRHLDQLVGSTRFGPHRSEWVIERKPCGTSSKHCSTGQQKMLLFSIILSFIRFFLTERSHTLILLLDDVIGHLDFDHRVLLFSELMEIQKAYVRLQIWITGTHREDFSFLDGYAQFVSVHEGTLINES